MNILTRDVKTIYTYIYTSLCRFVRSVLERMISFYLASVAESANSL